MNILIFSWRGPGHPLAGGAEQATREHAKGWTKAGHHVTLFTSVFPNCKAYENLDGIKIIRKGIDIFGVHLSAFWWYLFENHPRFDLVVDEFHGIPFFTPLYVRVKKLGFIHEVAQKVWSFNPWPKPFNLIPAVIGKIGEPLVLKSLYRQIPFLTVSESTKKDLEIFGVKKITVIHNGVNLPEKLPHFSKEKVFTVIYLSPLAKDKGIEDAIAAFGLFKQKHPRSKIWIVGKGISGYVSYLKSLCKSGKFWGYVSEKKKFELLARAHVLLNPSVHEGWGLVNIEASAMGLPVVGYNVSGVRDSVLDGKTGILAKEGEVNELTEALIKINSGFIEVRECKKWARKFTWKKSTTASVQLLQHIQSIHA